MEIFAYRHAARFLALHGVPRLAAILAQERPPAAVVRYAVAACEALALSSGCAGLEAMLGWWRPPPPQADDQVRPEALKRVRPPTRMVHTGCTWERKGGNALNPPQDLRSVF